MDLKINLLAKGNKLIVQDNTNYLQEGFSYLNYTKDQCESIILIESHETNNDPEESKLMTGSIGKLVDLIKDGYVTVHYIVLPKKEWIDHYLNTISSISNKTFFYIDDNDIYLFNENKPITYLELLNVCVSNATTNLIKTCTEHINIWNLYNCYINLCQLLLENRNFSKCYGKNTTNSELIYNRDLVWMTINVIEYLAQLNTESNPTAMKALQYIEMIHSCNGICPETNLNKNHIYGCGCSKR